MAFAELAWRRTATVRTLAIAGLVRQIDRDFVCIPECTQRSDSKNGTGPGSYRLAPGSSRSRRVVDADLGAAIGNRDWATPEFRSQDRDFGPTRDLEYRLEARPTSPRFY